MTTASNSDARKRLAARNTAPDTTGLREHIWAQGACTTHGCPGDPRYAAPGRQHAEGCRYPLPLIAAHPDPTPEPSWQHDHTEPRIGCRCRENYGPPEEPEPSAIWQEIVGKVAPTPEPDATASDPVALTDAERAAIRQTLVAEWRDDYSVLSLVNALAVTVAHIKAEAVEQERAARLALVAKIEALCDAAERNSDTYKRSCIVTTGKVRDALLDDTKATS